MRQDILNRKEEILALVDEKTPKFEIARRLGCNVKTLNTYLKTFGVEYHGNFGWAKGMKIPSKTYIPYEEYIQRANFNRNKLCKKLIREGYKEAKCERCQRFEWEGRPIPLEIHHVDGNRDNNGLDNLQILCPNCHALTDTYKGKNIKK